MDSTTEMQVNKILKEGYYRSSQTLGAGGWNKLHSTCSEWKKYVLFTSTEDDPFFEEIEKIVAKSDTVAEEAFASLYHLDEFEDWEIQERIVEYRVVSMK